MVVSTESRTSIGAMPWASKSPHQRGTSMNTPAQAETGYRYRRSRRPLAPRTPRTKEAYGATSCSSGSRVRSARRWRLQHDRHGDKVMMRLSGARTVTRCSKPPDAFAQARRSTSRSSPSVSTRSSGLPGMCCRIIWRSSMSRSTSRTRTRPGIVKRLVRGKTLVRCARGCIAGFCIASRRNWARRDRSALIATTSCRQLLLNMFCSG